MSNATLEENEIGSRVFITTLDRKHIEEGNFEPVFKLLNQCGILQPDEADPANLENMQFKVCLLVDGYQDEVSELVEVPEVCRYFQQLHAAWPYGLYFFNPQLETLQLLVWCNTDAKLVRKSNGKVKEVQVPAHKLNGFIRSAMMPFFKIAGQLDWPAEKVSTQITEISNLFNPTNEGCPPPEPVETIQQRHLASIKQAQTALSEAAKKAHQESGRGSLLVVPGNITYVAEAALADMGSGAGIEGLNRRIREYDSQKQFVICFCSGDGVHSYTMDLVGDHQIQPGITRSKPIKKTTLADCLVFKRVTNVTEYGLEAAKIVLDAIHDLRLTGRVEFLSGDIFATGNYALCVCFEPAKGFPMKFEDFWKPLRDTVQKHCQANGNLELEYWDCESFAVDRFRSEFLNQGTLPFADGLPQAQPNEDEVQSMWISLAIKGRQNAAKTTTK